MDNLGSPTAIKECAEGYKRSDSDEDDYTSCKPCLASEGDYASSVGSQKCDRIPDGSYAEIARKITCLFFTKLSNFYLICINIEQL